MALVKCLYTSMINEKGKKRIITFPSLLLFLGGFPCPRIQLTILHLLVVAYRSISHVLIRESNIQGNEQRKGQKP